LLLENGFESYITDGEKLTAACTRSVTITSVYWLFNTGVFFFEYSEKSREANS
jgi:hypothetical protein